ncbi:MAG: hypothetical protein RL122_2675, partial [Pseudomonadota bacterium]|jgi:hypothetical protein
MLGEMAGVEADLLQLQPPDGETATQFFQS